MGIRMLKYISAFLVIFIFTVIGVIYAQEGVVYIAKFNQENGSIPTGWEVKEWKGKADVRITNVDGGQVLCLKSRGTSTALYKDFEIDISETPYLNWEWKALKLPERGDVRNLSTDDQAAQVYVIFPKFPSQINSRIIGYIWDTNAPKDSMVTSTKFLRTKYIVIKSGQNGVGRWFAEKRNVYEDYKILFSEEPPKVGKISIMIDSDDTKSSAEACFTEIYLSKELNSAVSPKGK